MADVNVFDELQWRGLVHQTTTEDLRDVLGQEPLTCYAGFDPTAESLHVGHLLQILLLSRLQRAGHRPIAVLGGGTGMIGDPSGKSAERQLLTSDRVRQNMESIRGQLARFIDVEHGALVVDNGQWLGELRLVDFLRDVGKHFSVNGMIEKDSVRTRLREREQGISYTEFTYMLLQAFDYLHLFETYGCRLQVGGSDQWGNITSGVDLIRRVHGERAFGMTSPLLTNADGKKLGKTEKGAVWLDRDRTSPYQLYQYWMRVDDRDVVRLIRMLTERTRDEVDALERLVDEQPHRREAQRALAWDLTVLVHGEHEANEAKKASAALFGPDIRELEEQTLLDVMSEAPSLEVERSSLMDGKVGLVETLSLSGLCRSRSVARKDIGGGGVYINNQRETDQGRVLVEGDLLHGRYILLRKGKKNFCLVAVR